MRIVSYASAIAIAAVFGSAADAKLMGRNTTIGNWLAGAYSDDQTGRFSHCAASVDYKNGAFLLFSVNRQYQWSVGFVASELGVLKNDTLSVKLGLDDSADDTVQAHAISKNVLSVSLSPSSDLFKRFMRANLLRLSSTPQTSFAYQFNLQDTSKLLPYLLKCVRDRLNPPPLQAQSNQPVRQASQSPASTAGVDLRAEVTALAANLLSEAGVKGFKIAPSTDDNTSVNWTSSGGSGALLVVLDQDAKRPSDLTPVLISIAARKCKGKFVSGAMPEENGTARSFSSCQIGTAEPRTGYYIALPRESGGHYVIMTWPEGASANQSQSQEPDKDIRNAAYRVLR